MKILSKLDNTGMIEEVADKRYVTDAEKLTWNAKADKTYVDSQDALKVDKTEFDEHKEDLEKHITESERINWNSKSVEDLGAFNDEMELFTRILQLPTGHYTFTVEGLPVFMSLWEMGDIYSGMLYYNYGMIVYFELSLSGEILDADVVELRNLANLTNLPTFGYVDSQDALKADKTYVDNQDALKADKTYVDNQDLKKMPISGGVLENYREKIVTVDANGGNIDLSLGNVFVHTASGNTTYAITNAVSGQAHSFTLIINMGSDVRTITFPASVKWQEGEIPEMLTANATYVLTFMSVNGGATWLGMFGGEWGTYLAKDSDFSGERNGDFRYIGTETELEIPNVIKGVPVTSYERLFNSDQGKLVTKVVSTNSGVTNMDYMFSSSLATTLDLSSFDTSSVTNMNYMFYNSQATTLDLSSFNTSNVTDMQHMFQGSQATTLDLSNFNTSNVTNMRNMFQSSQATTLDLSSFDTSSASDMSYMFYGSRATTLDLSSFDTSSVTNMSGMFYNSLATTLDLSSFDTSSVTTMSAMFNGSQATTLDLSSFDTSSVTNMGSMFNGSQVTTLDLSNFDTSSVTYIGGMFRDSLATTLDLSNFETSNVTNMTSMFRNSQATTLDLSSFNTSKVTDMSDMFYGSRATTLDLSSFDTSSVTNMSGMFRESQATTLDLSSFDTSNVTNMSYMFRWSATTTGWARTQADADRFNASSNKPAALTFVVKP